MASATADGLVERLEHRKVCHAGATDVVSALLVPAAPVLRRTVYSLCKQLKKGGSAGYHVPKDVEITVVRTLGIKLQTRRIICTSR